MKKNVTFWSLLGLIYTFISLLRVYKSGEMDRIIKASDEDFEEIWGDEWTDNKRVIKNASLIGITGLLIWPFWPFIMIAQCIIDLCYDCEREEAKRINKKKGYNKFSRYSIK